MGEKCLELTGLAISETTPRNQIRRKETSTDAFMKMMAQAMNGAKAGLMPQVKTTDAKVTKILTAIERCIKRGERATARDTALFAAAIAYGESVRGLTDVIECLRDEYGLDKEEKEVLDARIQRKGSKP
jgi:hypothetical protein